MKSVFLFIVFTLLNFNFLIEKSLYYDILESGSIEEIDDMILKLEKEKTSPLNLAYKGTLIAKKASFIKNAKTKISLFKSGIKLLENEIYITPSEVEYRFLRLAIQEKCPKLLKYNKNLNEDRDVILAGFSKLRKDLKKIILDYSKNSDVLISSTLK
jgi:hypothetical protein